MPTYEFTCKDCENHFDVLTSISKKKEITCPKCGSQKLQEFYGVFFVGGNVTKPGAGTGSSCTGPCTTCGDSCKP